MWPLSGAAHAHKASLERGASFLHPQLRLPRPQKARGKNHVNRVASMGRKGTRSTVDDLGAWGAGDGAGRGAVLPRQRGEAMI